MKQTRSMFELSCLFEYTRLYHSLWEFMFYPGFQFVLSRIPSFEGWYLEIVGAWNWLFVPLSSFIFSFQILYDIFSTKSDINVLRTFNLHTFLIYPLKCVSAGRI